MKVTGGLVGMSLNAGAQTEFFLAPELSRCSAKDMAGVSSTTQKKHHNLAAAVLSHEDKNIKKPMRTISSFTDPFSEQGTELFNCVKNESDTVGKDHRRSA